MNNSKQALKLALTRLVAREFSKSSPKNSEVVSKRILKLRENQKKFQLEDSTPVYIKGGLGDRMLYGVSVIMATVGLGMSLDVFYKLTFRK